MDDSATDVLHDRFETRDLDPAPPQARGPHLPDAVTAVSFGTWFFVLLALARLIWFVRETELGPAPGLAVLVGYVGGFVPAVAAILLPAALLLRHPDAATTARTLLVGTILFAAVEGMRVAGPALRPFFEQVTPGSEETPYLVPLALFYTSAQGLIATFAVANMGLGLAQARRYLDRSWTLVIAIVAGLVVIAAAAARVITVSRLPFDQIPMTPTVAVYLSSAIILGILSISAWGYLAATAARGSRAGEEPGSGWLAFAVGAWAILAAFSVGAITNLAEPTPETQELFTTLIQAISLVYTVGYLALLAGLLLGLPAVEPVDDDDKEADDEDKTDDESETDVERDDVVALT
jgi:hypothetical protein